MRAAASLQAGLGRWAWQSWSCQQAVQQLALRLRLRVVLCEQVLCSCWLRPGEPAQSQGCCQLVLWLLQLGLKLASCAESAASVGLWRLWARGEPWLALLGGSQVTAQGLQAGWLGLHVQAAPLLLLLQGWVQVEQCLLLLSCGHGAVQPAGGRSQVQKALWSQQTHCGC